MHDFFFLTPSSFRGKSRNKIQLRYAFSLIRTGRTACNISEYLAADLNRYMIQGLRIIGSSFIFF